MEIERQYWTIWWSIYDFWNNFPFSKKKERRNKFIFYRFDKWDKAKRYKRKWNRHKFLLHFQRIFRRLFWQKCFKTINFLWFMMSFVKCCIKIWKESENIIKFWQSYRFWNPFLSFVCRLLLSNLGLFGCLSGLVDAFATHFPDNAISMFVYGFMLQYMDLGK